MKDCHNPYTKEWNVEESVINLSSLFVPFISLSECKQIKTAIRKFQQKSKTSTITDNWSVLTLTNATE